MPVYIDSMNAKFSNMVMCHMMADSTEELLQMVDKINVQRKWIQDAGTPQEHFDICLSKKKLALAAGAKEVGWKEIATIIENKTNNKKMDFKLKGLVNAVFPAEVFGNFEKRVLWLTEDTGAKYPQTWAIEAQQGDTPIFDKIKPGDKVEAHITLLGVKRSKNGKETVWNSLKCTYIVKL